jgi:quercetin dioxygenase-like cupin family protein
MLHSIQRIGALLGLGALLLGCAGNAKRTRLDTAPAEGVVTELMTKTLADLPGKEATMITVVYAPGGADPAHRHDAHTFVYVLEGSIVMGVKGGQEVTLRPGQTFYEAPDDIHTVSRNASSTEPAKFLVLQIKPEGAPVLIPLE